MFADFTPPPGTSGKYIAITFDDFLAEALATAGSVLRQRGIPSTWFVVSDALGTQVDWIRATQRANDGAPIGSAECLRQLDPSLFRIGSHGAHHVPLTTLPPSEAVGQLAESRELLSRLAGGNVNSISFPYGDYDPALLDLVREAGYRFGYSNVAVWPWLSSNGMLRGRVSVEPFDWRLEFWLKIRGAYGWQALGGHWRHQWLPRLRNRPLASGTRATALPAPDIGSTIRQACSKRPFG